ncbi:Nif11-like leader peptide family natural product precursor [Megalodesulfovibrio gigas]|uniref:Nif11 domain-containing protein n=1 Tax=Megalodesulfovibrio gigas (strain ATCC 19364 / DSM 1382 / NCIMB 9332 / VKM B-1759) TaxID=1121448 RepID=T2GFE3_MEGG1|nr:Nif11-like leader peptide family natural product precursor [Megalodesulfovibrio gigas]AGW14904.1 hypothetical protein DGI_3196 [Megalodesulfovibrio gigas DSM 1382 = ATCC 19364]
MSIDDALAYMKRMREDPAFRTQVQALHDGDDQDAAWAFVKEQGYEFNFSEFLQAQQEDMESLTLATPQ